MIQSIREPELLEDLKLLSRDVGLDPLLVQGSGGNTSLKDGDILWVKASGFWLAHAEDQDIFVPLSLETVFDLTARQVDSYESARLQGKLNPSIESALHAFLPHPVVTHVHSVNAIARTVHDAGRAGLPSALQDFKWRYIEYARPGAALAKSVADMSSRSGTVPDLLILENHGYVLGSGSTGEARTTIQEIENKLGISEREIGLHNDGAIARIADGLSSWGEPKLRAIHRIAFDDLALDIVRSGPLIPDHAVFLSDPVAVVTRDQLLESSPTVLERYRETGWIIVENTGVLVNSNFGPSAEAQLNGIVDIALRLPIGAAFKTIRREEVVSLQNWDAEQLRLDLDKNTSS